MTLTELPPPPFKATRTVHSMALHYVDALHKQCELLYQLAQLTNQPWFDRWLLRRRITPMVDDVRDFQHLLDFCEKQLETHKITNQTTLDLIAHWQQYRAELLISKRLKRRIGL